MKRNPFNSLSEPAFQTIFGEALRLSGVGLPHIYLLNRATRLLFEV
ncbi:MAG: hypothetical protein ACUVTP_08995 [Candidatus Fervidibacter sp.]